MSQTNGAELIGRLSAGIRPSSAGGSDQRGDAIGSFEALLSKAESGTIESGLPITLARGVELQLSPSDMHKLSVLVDRAQSQGASQALVITDQGMFELDVLRRRITGVIDPTESGKDVLTGFDTVLRLNAGGAQDPAALHGPLPLPDGRFNLAGHQSLLDAIEKGSGTTMRAG